MINGTTRTQAQVLRTPLYLSHRSVPQPFYLPRPETPKQSPWLIPRSSGNSWNKEWFIKGMERREEDMMLETKYWETSTILNNSSSGLIWWIPKAKSNLFVLSVMGLSPNVYKLITRLILPDPFSNKIDIEKAKHWIGPGVVCSTLPGPLSDEAGLHPLHILELLPTGTETSICELFVHSLSPLCIAGSK